MLLNAIGGGGGVKSPENVTEVYGSTALALRGHRWVSKHYEGVGGCQISRKKHYVTLE